MDEVGHNEQIEQAGLELDALIRRCSLEYDIPYASMIGLLHIKASELTLDLLNVGMGSN